MSCFNGDFDGELFGRQVATKVTTNFSYMYLAGMEKPDFRTINRFEVDNVELINYTFKELIIGTFDGV